MREREKEKNSESGRSKRLWDVEKKEERKTDK